MKILENHGLFLEKKRSAQAGPIHSVQPLSGLTDLAKKC